MGKITICYIEENTRGCDMIDYKQQAQELFNLLMTATGICEDIQMFNYLCDRYPELMENHVKRIEEEAEQVELPKMTEEEEQRQYNELMKRIEEYEQSKKSDN